MAFLMLSSRWVGGSEAPPYFSRHLVFLQAMIKLLPPCLVDHKRGPSPGVGQHRSREDEQAGLEGLKIPWCWDNVDPPWSHTQPEAGSQTLGSRHR